MAITLNLRDRCAALLTLVMLAGPASGQGLSLADQPLLADRDKLLRGIADANRRELGERLMRPTEIPRTPLRPVVPVAPSGMAAGNPPAPIAPGVVPVTRPDRNLLRERLAENAVIGARANLLPAPRAIAALRRATARDDSGGAVSVLQFSRRLTPTDRAALADQGIGVEGFAGGSSYIVSLPPDAALPDAVAGILREGRVLDARAKLRANLRLDPDDPAAEASDATGTYLLRLSSDTALQGLRAALGERGATAIEEVAGGLIALKAAPGDLEAIAGLGDVVAIDAGPPPFLALTDGVREAVGLSSLQTLDVIGDAPTFGGYLGTGVRIAIFDEQVDAANHDFCALVDGPRPRFFRPVVRSEVCIDDFHSLDGPEFFPVGELHGTQVASVAAGSGANTPVEGGFGGQPTFGLRGVAPAAILGNYDHEHATRTPLGYYALALLDDRADLSNHSYVESHGLYSEISAFLDQILSGRATEVASASPDSPPRPLPARPQVWAAGNNALVAARGTARTGYHSVFTQAKNTISVGSYDTTTGEVSRFSSLGPTFDGRIKPDLVAPGCHDSRISASEGGVRMAAAGFQGYMRDCGTSMAAPVVAGTIALMTEAAGPGASLPPSAFKAILIATAQDLMRTEPAGDEPPNTDTGTPLVYHRGPDFATGFGLLDAAAAVRLIATPGALHVSDVSDAAPGRSVCFELAADHGNLRLAMAWDDPPAAATDFASTYLINDLDLVLTAPDGTRHFPWTLPPPPLPDDLDRILDGEPDPLAAGDIRPALRDGEPDRVNTVELVEVDAPEAGIWRADVTAPILGDGPQVFSLAGDVMMRDCED